MIARFMSFYKPGVTCDDLLSMPCTSHIDACSSSTVQYETNFVEENKELQSQVKYLSNKIEGWTKSKVTLESIIKTKEASVT